MTTEVCKLVEEFHRKFGFPVNQPPKGLLSIRDEDMLREIQSAVGGAAVYLRDRLQADPKLDVRIARIQLIAEEFAELILAMRNDNAGLIADSLADLAYVVAGTAVVYGMPLQQLIEEVHRSNMTKDVDGRHKPCKGAHYSPPDIAAVLWRYSRG